MPTLPDNQAYEREREREFFSDALLMTELHNMFLNGFWQDMKIH